MPTVFDHPRLCVAMLPELRPPCWPDCQGINPLSTVCLWERDATVRTQKLLGDHRVARGDRDTYALWHGVDDWPDLTAAPDYTDTAAITTAALSYGHRHYFVLQQRNAHGLLSENGPGDLLSQQGDTLACYVIELDGAGEVVGPPPSAPTDAAIVPAAAGVMSVSAHYLATPDGAYAADTWLIYLTATGADPDPDLDTPTEVAMTLVDGLATLAWNSPAQADQATIKILIRSRRSGVTDVDSENLDIHSAVASTQGLDIDQAHGFLGTLQEQVQNGP